MPDILIALGAFITTILFLVTIHEYGHYAMARYFGVKIEKFSVGFGKPIIKWYNKAGIEFSISWIPLGGYVKMHGETPNEKRYSEAQTEPQQDDISDFTRPQPTGKSFADLPPIQRLLIAFAGPAVNLLFTILVFWVMFVIGKEAIKPIVGEVQPTSIIASANIQLGDEITHIDGKRVIGDTNTTIELMDNIGTNVHITYLRNGQTNNTTLNLTNLPVGSEKDVNQALGFDWLALSELQKLYPAKIGEVLSRTPASKAGLRADDEIVAINGKPISLWSDFTALVKQNVEKPLTLDVSRNNKQVTLTLTPKAHAQNPKVGFAGIRSIEIDDANKQAILKKYQVIEHYGVFTALPKAIGETGNQAIFLLKSIQKVITGIFSVKILGGPLSIADYSGKTIQAGWYMYFNFLAMISLTLAVMNLLPIPVLDGGHILICAIEIIRGKPLPEKGVEIAMRIGISVLLTFMVMMVLLDLMKYLG